jgi:DNA/RNA-binding domain of Phe-tRNA-synthetase-like protein
LRAFGYHPNILATFPDLCGGVILARDLRAGSTPQSLQQAFMTEQRRVLERIGTTPLSELEPLAAWRSAFRTFGVDPTKYRSAVEALLRRLTKKGDIPSIHTLVDLCNLVSIRYSLPVAAFDVRDLQGGIQVRFAKGDEDFKPLGEAQIEHPEPGEVIFSDESRLVVARRWCWRQSAESAARQDTPEAIFTVEAQHRGGRRDVEAAVKDLLDLSSEYAGGSYRLDILGPGAAAEISW